jgi:NAD(P)-dependent dehydrogenase (short-subunit alcohol dehydrogenase family)
LATAKAFLKEGAKVVLTDIDQNHAANAIKDLNTPNATGIKADVTSKAELQKSIDLTLEKFGKINVFFANAGIEGVVSPVELYPVEIFKKVLEINVIEAFLRIKTVWPYMKKSGGDSIIITSSVVGLIGSPLLSAYVTSKHAVLGLMRSAASEGTPLGIRVNCIHPVPIENRMMASIEDGMAPDAGEQVKASYTQLIRMKRYGRNEEVAHMAVFLASDESSYCTGSSFVIDGGLHST